MNQEIVERVMEAISQPTHISQRTNKGGELPFEVIDTSSEPRVLSRWRDPETAAEHRNFVDTRRRAIAAIEVMRAALRNRTVIWRAMIDEILKGDAE